MVLLLHFVEKDLLPVSYRYHGLLKQRKISAARESYQRKPYCHVSIYNSGPAIPDADITQIFDPFFSSRDPGKGLGLGMSLCYMIIREHGGKLEVRNDSPGVSFEIWLPAWAEKLTREDRGSA